MIHSTSVWVYLLYHISNKKATEHHQAVAFLCNPLIGRSSLTDSISHKATDGNNKSPSIYGVIKIGVLQCSNPSLL